MISQATQKHGLEHERLLKFKQLAHNALSDIESVRHGCNVTSTEIWRACEQLDSLISSINMAIKEHHSGN